MEEDFVSLITSKLSTPTQNHQSSKIHNLEAIKDHIEKSHYYHGYFSHSGFRNEAFNNEKEKSKLDTIQIEPKNCNPNVLSKNVCLNISIGDHDHEYLCEIVAYSSRVCLSILPFSTLNDLDVIMSEIENALPCQALTFITFLNTLQPVDQTDDENLIISKELMSSIFIENRFGISQELVVRSQSCKYLIPLESSSSSSSVVKSEVNDGQRITCTTCSNLLEIPKLFRKTFINNNGVKNEEKEDEGLNTDSEDDDDYYNHYELQQCSVILDNNIKSENNKVMHTFPNYIRKRKKQNLTLEALEEDDDGDREYILPTIKKKNRKSVKRNSKPKDEFDSNSDNDSNYDPSTIKEGTSKWVKMTNSTFSSYFSNGYAYIMEKNYRSRKQLICGNAKVTEKLIAEKPCMGRAIINNTDNLLYVQNPHSCSHIAESDYLDKYRDPYYYDPEIHPGTDNYSQVQNPGSTTNWFSEGYSYRNYKHREDLVILNCKNKSVIKKSANKCDGCAIYDKNTKLLHLKVPHSCDPMTEEEFLKSPMICDICGDGPFSNANEKKAHLEEHRSKNALMCKECGEGPFKDVQERKSHSYTHRLHRSKIKRRMQRMKEREQRVAPEVMKCPFCEKTFTKIGRILRHCHMYHEDKDFNALEGHDKLKAELAKESLEFCEICGKSVRNLIMHNGNVHEKNYECEICHEKFGTAAYFSHMRKVHTKSSSFCEDCGLTFDSNMTLKNHWKKAHDPTRVETFKCPVDCDFVTTIEKDFYAHLNKDHHYNWKCDICGKVFTRSTGLNDHMTIHTQKKEFFCFLCPYATGRFMYFLKHRKRKHKLKDSMTKQDYHAQSAAINRTNEIR